MLILEVIDGYAQPYTVGEGEKRRIKQKIFLHNGSAYPVECNISLEGPHDSLPVGKYTLEAAGYVRDKFGAPTINNWDLRKHLLLIKDHK